MIAPTSTTGHRPDTPRSTRLRLMTVALLCVVVAGGAMPLRAATTASDSDAEGAAGSTVTAATRDLRATDTATGHLERTDERTVGHGGTVAAETTPTDGTDPAGDDGDDGDREEEPVAADPVDAVATGDGEAGIVLTSASSGTSGGGLPPPCADATTYGEHPSEQPEPCPSEEPSEEPSAPGEPSEEPSAPEEPSEEPSAPEEPSEAPTEPVPTTPAPVGPQQGGVPGVRQPGGQAVMPGGGPVMSGGAQTMPGGGGRATAGGPGIGAAGGRTDTAPGVEELVAPAILTALPALGTAVERGTTIYEAGGEPVVALSGSIPLWRTLETGVDNGADVRQLERNLETLGYGDDLTVDRKFTDATAAAVEAWERDLDREDPDGVVEPGDIVYLTAPGKVIGHDAAVGETLTAGAPVVTISGDAQLVVADVPVAALDTWSRGTAVELRWEDHGDVTTGAVSSIGRDAAGSGDAATLEVVVTLDEQVEGRPDQSEVSVSLTSATRAGVVAVPVTAIIAGEDGRPAVRLVDGATERVVAVTTGLVDGGWIEVRDGLSPGDVVRLPG